MNLEGRKIIVNKSAAEIAALLKDPENYRELMPDGLQTFESRDNGFKFSLKGMPEIALKIDKADETGVDLKSASSSLDFDLKGAMTPLNDAQTEAQLLFTGNFNPFIKMMVEKPLQNFIDALTDKIEKI